MKSILDELAIPPLLDNDSPHITRLPFSDAALKNYAADVSLDEIFKDVQRYPLRVATLRALQTVRDTWPLGGKSPKLPSAMASPVTDQAKKSVTKAQESLAVAIVRLEVELDNLAAVAPKREKETKRWQAHYDYTLAELRLRYVMLNEYNRALAHVKTESLPDLPAGATEWRLVSSAKLEGKRDAQKLFADANESFSQMALAYKGTPWEVLAKRSLATLPAARWEPVVLPK